MGAALAAIPDSLLILEAYKRWGEACIEHLLGDFAFAIWDSRKQRLFCARDPVGGAGFAFHEGKDYFAFATESEALLQLPSVSRAPNENYVAGLFVPSFENLGDRRTWLRDVLALLPGETLTVGACGQVRIRPYGGFGFGPERAYASYAESEEHFLSIFGQAVRDRMRGRGDVAAMMSGGLDSAAIVAMARRLVPGVGGKGLHAYSAVHDEPESCIESRCIESLRATFDLNLHAVQVPSFRGPVSVEDLVDLAWKQAHPVNNSILLPALMSVAASREGHKTILHGAAGDLATAAPHYYPGLLLRKGRWSEAWRECKAASAHNYFLQGEPPVSIFARSLLRAFVPPAVSRWRQQLRRASQPVVPQRSLISAEFARAINLPQLVTEEFRARQQALKSDPSGFRRRQNLFLISSGLSGYSSAAGRYGMEARDPWSDRRVLDFFFRLPVSFKVRDGWTKALQRTAFGQDLAPVVRERHDKRHLGWLFTARLMRESGELLSSVLFEESSPIEQYADLQSTREVFLRFLRTGDFESTQTVFEMATLIFWLRRIKTL